MRLRTPVVSRVISLQRSLFGSRRRLERSRSLSWMRSAMSVSLVVMVGSGGGWVFKEQDTSG